MIKSYTINMKEIDDIEFALEELNEQMADIPLLKNTIGIVSLNIDYITSGVYAAIAQAIPFPLVGGTTLATATRQEMGSFLFSILILTSDDCEFSCAVSNAIPDKGSIEKVTQQCYKDALDGLSCDAKIAFLFAPLLKNHYAEKYLTAMSALNKRVPIFGTLSLDVDDDKINSGNTLFNKENFDDRLIIVAASGNINPKFYLGSVSDECIIMPNVGVITKSDENFVTEINGISIESFFEKIGYNPEDLDTGATTIGFIMHEKNENDEVVSYKFSGILSIKDGVGMFDANIPEGTVMSVMTTTKEDIMKTAQTVIKELKENHNGGTALLYSCGARMFCLLNEPMKEHEYARDELSKDFSFLIASSGGEICPTLVSDVEVYNRGHSHSLILCVF